MSGYARHTGSDLLAGAALRSRAEIAGSARETWPVFAARVAAALAAAAERSTVVSTSGGVIAAACVALLGVAPETFVALNRVTVNAGAGAITLPAGARDVNLSLNAGSLEVCLPAGAAVLVNWAGALGSNNFSAAGLVRVDDTTWTSSGFDALRPHTELHVSANAGSFELRFGGTCRA